MEPTLSAQWNDLQGDIGFFLGYGRGLAFGESAWSTQQQSSIDRCVKGGMRKFYYCGYDWSFLKPVANLSLAAGSVIVPLPDDFGGFDGQITIASPTGQTWIVLDITGIGEIYTRQGQYPTMTGRPQIACQEPVKGTTATQSNRSQLHVFPIADQAYTLRAQYYINPDYLSGAFPYAYGGPEHAETLLEGCLAVAEKLLDDTSGVHDAEFDKLLEVSTDIDRRKKPQTLGYNRDNSDYMDRTWQGPRLGHLVNPISYKGTVY